MDIVMPGSLDGIDASEIIINELDIPVIFLTAYGDDAYIDRAKKICPSGYIIKPYHPDEIKAAIEIATAQKSQRAAADSIIERFRLLADSLPFGIALVNSEFRILFWNKEAAYITGYTENDAVDLSFNFFIDEPHRDAFERQAGALLSPAARFEGARPLLFDDIPGSKKDCSDAVYSISLSASCVESEPLLLCTIRDTTSRSVISATWCAP
jgi:PAS domain S-box-containing protein